MIMWESVMQALPARSKGRRPKKSILQMDVVTPTSCVMLRTPDMMSCMLWFKPIVPKSVGE